MELAHRDVVGCRDLARRQRVLVEVGFDDVLDLAQQPPPRLVRTFQSEVEIAGEQRGQQDDRSSREAERRKTTEELEVFPRSIQETADTLATRENDRKR